MHQRKKAVFNWSGGKDFSIRRGNIYILKFIIDYILPPSIGLKNRLFQS